MESIKETELNLQREQVTTVGNTWLVKAVNPSTGEEKMIDVSNFSSVVAGEFSTSLLWKLNSKGLKNLDLDSTPSTSMYYFEGEPVNTPSGVKAGACLTFGYGSSFKLQFVITPTRVLYVRLCASSTWTDWRTL